MTKAICLKCGKRYEFCAHLPLLDPDTCDKCLEKEAKTKGGK